MSAQEETPTEADATIEVDALTVEDAAAENLELLREPSPTRRVSLAFVVLPDS